MMFTTELYPQVEIKRNTNPNRLYAIPLFGFLVKLLFIIPVGLELMVLYFVAFILSWLINPFVVLITGKYWQTAYNLNAGIFKLSIKTSYYFYGLTDNYPYFNFEPKGFTINIPQAQKSSRIFAIPLIGLLIRVIVLIPYSIFSQIMQTASLLAVFCTFAPVLFKGYYPETTHEIAKDAIRVNIAQSAYIFGLRDTYPSFSISWNHKTMKISLLIIATLLFLMNFASSLMPKSQPTQFKQTDFLIDYQTQSPEGSLNDISQ